MEPKRCFNLACMLDVEYVCQCTSPGTYICEQHLGKHLKVPNKSHNFDSIFLEPCEGTKETILNLLIKKNEKYNKLKKKILASFSERLLESKKDLEDVVKEIDAYSAEISNWFAKVSDAKKISKSDQDPILRLLSFQPDEAAKKVKSIFKKNPDWYNSAKMFCGFNEKIEKMIEWFIKDKFESHLDQRLDKIENILEEHDKAISLKNSDIENIKDSISEIINENQKNKREFEDWKKAVEVKIENEVALLNSQIVNVTEDLENKFKKNKNIINVDIIKEKTAEILNRPNCPELEMDFRRICLEYESNSSVNDPQISQAYEDYLNAYHQQTSLYNIIKNDNKTHLWIYDTETDTKTVKILDTPQPLDESTCITQLPNRKLFCFDSATNITLIIDINGSVEELPLPPETFRHCTSGVYSSNNIYYFGVTISNFYNITCFRFDLAINRWVQLNSLPEPVSSCNSIIFNRKILIVGCDSCYMYRYSIDTDSFTKIPYLFSACKAKILMNSERLYLIEGNEGFIYGCEIGSDTDWIKIGNSVIENYLCQTYCIYNKGAIYIGCPYNRYFKFYLNEKRLTVWI